MAWTQQFRFTTKPTYMVEETEKETEKAILMVMETEMK